MEEKKSTKISLGMAFIITLVIVFLVVLIICAIVLNLEKDKIRNESLTASDEGSVPAVINQRDEKTTTDIKHNEGLNVVPTMQDKISGNSAWCATFQLVWNDMKNEVVKKDIVFTPQEEMAKNLNKEEFTSDMISNEYYYKVYGLKTLELKDKIEKGILEKFNQKSDIIDDIDWSDDALNGARPDIVRYLFYCMLYRKFEFMQKFDKLDKGKFGTKYNDVEYFGIDDKTESEVGNQIDVLFYNSENDFAISINTKSGDEVIFYKNPKGSNFKEIYENMNKYADKFKGDKVFNNIDVFKAPKLEVNQKREYTEFQDKEFLTLDNNVAEIYKAIQSIKFSLDENGGEIKSEAIIDMKTNAMISEEPEQPRKFYVDDTFAIFLKEQGKDVPYFAGRIEDISKIQ